MLALSKTWRQWQGLQRWIVAVGLSIAFYPVLFYGLGLALPFLTLGPYKMSALLLLFAAITAWRMRQDWKELFRFGRLEWIALGVFGMTIFTRFWIIRDHPYPAWSDSLHHTLLTQLTAEQGELPSNLEPFFPVPLNQYHLGLYAFSASVQWLARVPAHTALLWTVQILNGLCGAGVYLALDRKVGRRGAIAGAAVVGLLSHQPAFYVNWGRFTQGSSQAILLIAWLITWEAIVLWKQPWQEHRAKILWNTAAAAILTGAVFLFHFRVAAFYIPLLAISVTGELWQARKEKKVGRVVLGTAVIGIAALLIVTPALWSAIRVYVIRRLGSKQGAATGRGKSTEAKELYYIFPWDVIPLLVARTWLMVLAIFSAVLGLIKRNKLVITCLAWMILLYVIGNAHALGLPLLNITNLGAVLVMFYLPIGLIIGSAVETSLNLLKPHWRESAVKLTMALILTSSFAASHVRVTEIESARHFVTPADAAAMNWIKHNTPADATFAVNTYFWLPRMPHGTDAGYWIPYFTGRQTTAGVMLLFLAKPKYISGVVEMSQAVERLQDDNAALADLKALGVDYVYIGQKGDFSVPGPGLDAARLAQAPNVHVLYQKAGVFILQIKAPDGAD